MAKQLFASNSISHFPGTEISGNTAFFASSRVPYAIQTQAGLFASSPRLLESSTNQTWFHFRNGRTTWNANSTNRICQIIAEGGALLVDFWFRSNSGGYNAVVRQDGQTFAFSRSLPNTANQLRTYDIRMDFDGLNYICLIYCNELQLFSFNFPASGFTKPAFIWFGGTEDSQSYYSEILVSEDDTRNARVDLLRPAAVGAYGNWLGPVSALADDDPTTGMTTTLADQSQSTVLTPYSGALNISNVVQVTTSVRGLNSPERMNHLLRLGGVDYLSDDFVLPFEKQFQVTDWGQNPGTSQPWEASDLTLAEFGFRSKA